MVLLPGDRNQRGRRLRPSATVNAITRPNIPAGLTATVVSGVRIDLVWTDLSAVESNYYIEQSLDGVTGWSQIGTAAANATSFSASGPFNGSATYFFRVRAMDTPAVTRTTPSWCRRLLRPSPPNRQV